MPERRSSLETNRRINTRMRPVALILLSLVGANLSAQTESQNLPAEENDQILDEIVVTAFQRSLQSAIEIKRSSDSVVEAISAEDLGRLPDVSIAEALARLPGINSQRVNGQSSAINIRGLSQ